MNIDIRRRANVELVRLNGPLKLGNGVEEFRRALEELIAAGNSCIVLNLAEVPQVDSSGIGALVRFQTSARQRGGAVKLVNPSKFATLTLQTVGVLSIFDVFPDDETAVASFGSTGAL